MSQRLILVLPVLVVLTTLIFSTLTIGASPRMSHLFSRKTLLNLFRIRPVLAMAGWHLVLFLAFVSYRVQASFLWLVMTLAMIAFLSVMDWSWRQVFKLRSYHCWERLSTEKANTLLDENCRILGYYKDGKALAITKQSLVLNPMFCPKLGEQSVCLTFSPFSDSAVALKIPKLLDDQCWNVASFPSNNVLFRHPTSGGFVQQLLCHIEGGPLSGISIPYTPVYETTWTHWRQLCPESEVITRELGFQDTVWLDRLSENTEEDNPNPFFRMPHEIDSRTFPKERVLGIVSSEGIKAYTLDFLADQQVINDTIGDLPILVIYHPEHQLANVLVPEVDNKILEFEPEVNPKGFFVDCKTKSEWNLFGECFRGELKGTSLTVMPHFNRVFWFVFADFFPQTELVGNSDHF